MIYKRQKVQGRAEIPEDLPGWERLVRAFGGAGPKVAASGRRGRRHAIPGSKMTTVNPPGRRGVAS